MGNSWPNYRCQQSRPSLASAIGAFLVAQMLVVSWLPGICAAQHAPAGAGLVGVLDLGRMGVGDTGEATRVEGLEVTVGFGGVWKLGQVLPVHVQGPSLSNPTARYLVAKTFDGDGVEVLYRRELTESEREAADSWFSIRVGRRGQRLSIELQDESMAVLQSAEIATTANAESLDSDQLLVLAIGSSMGIESQILRNALGTDSNFSVQVIDDPTQLPPHYRDYGACDLLVVSTQDQELLGAIGQKWQAIDGWLRQGGNGVVSLAALKEETLADLPVLATLLPGKIVGTGMVTDPGPLESLVAAANDPLNRISVAILEPTRGEIKLSFKDSLGKQVPWWIHTAHGNGNVHVIASDLAQESFEEWRERGELWLRLLEAFYEREVIDGGLAAEGRKDSYLGYNDLVGQLRAGMDTFPSLTTLSFGQISAMLVCVLLVVGPLDYYLSIKVLKRPQFSWYFAGISLVVFCSGLLFLYQLIRPNEVHVNSVQIVDFDASNGKMSGQLWTHVYAGKANRLDLSVRLDDGNLEFESSTASPTVDWQGLPGNGLGGLDSQISAGSGMPPYEIVVGTSQEMLGVPIATAGTKCLNAHWMNDTSLQNTFRLQELAGVEQLAGEFTNPFQVDIRDAYIFYHKWFYRLNSRIPAGGRFVISADMIPKDFSRKLNERKTISENVSGTRWDPANRSNLDRMLEMLMFYRAASGRNYTGLDHRYQPHLDFSNLLETDTAVLVCRLEKPFASLNVEVEGATTPTVIQDVDRVWCRITIPITESVRFSSSSGL